MQKILFMGLAHVFRRSEYVTVEILIPKRELANRDLGSLHRDILIVQLQRSEHGKVTWSDYLTGNVPRGKEDRHCAPKDSAETGGIACQGMKESSSISLV